MTLDDLLPGGVVYPNPVEPVREILQEREPFADDDCMLPRQDVVPTECGTCGFVHRRDLGCEPPGVSTGLRLWVLLAIAAALAALVAR